ncbi:accessory gene regulator B family protein [Paenibacillus abyssi]|uniref:accessory gene regulator B family protein n=1 Tax=Paenibacillus abyssi TaxID=1340531 RepID=UPI0035711D84
MAEDCRRNKGSRFWGNTAEVLTVLIAFALLRQISGGIHLRSSKHAVDGPLFTLLY